MPGTVKLRGASFVPLFVVLLVACGQNSDLGDATLSTPTATSGSSASSSPTLNNVPQPVRTDISQHDIPQPEETKIAVATQAVIAATAWVENATRTAVAVGTMQAYMRLTPTIPPPEEVGHGDFGTWRYKAYRYYGPNGGIRTVTNFDTTTVESLYAYSKANQELAEQMADKGGIAEVGITFRTYVEPDKFRSWVKAHGLRVEESVLRITEIRPGHTLDATAGIGAQDDEPLPPDRIKSLLVPVGSRNRRATPSASGEGEGSADTKNIMRGVYVTIATVDARELPGIAADPLVFLSDVTQNVVRNELVADGVQGAENMRGNKNMTSLEVIFLKMEHDFGLDKFQK